MTPTETTTNAYWDAVKDHVRESQMSWNGGPAVDWLTPRDGAPRRDDYVRRYAWTITHPATVGFVAAHSGGRLVDPLAGTGWWAHILGEAGVDVIASDLEPGANTWSDGLYATVSQGDAVDVVPHHRNRTLLLAWPPYASDLGERILAAYPGRRVIYIGEGEGGCCADDGFFEALRRDWAEVDAHVPVQWDGIHDVITVYDRT